jgi:sensor histidine kinase YesM
MPTNQEHTLNAKHPLHEILAGKLRFLAVWAIIGLTFALQWLPWRQEIGAPDWAIVIFAFTYTGIWALPYPLLAVLTRRLLRKNRSWPFHLAIYLPLGILLTIGHLSLYYGFYRLFKLLFAIDYYKSQWLPFIKENLFFDCILFGLLLLTIYLLEFTRLLRDRQRHTQILEQELITAQLQGLKMQLQPHFLFNTLNSVMALMDEDIQAAKHMVARLAAFLRATLEVPASGTIPLARELELARLYLQIEMVRYQSRLQVHFLNSDQVPDMQVPALILQPLVENAVRHGIAPYTRNGEIWLTVETGPDNLRLTIKNTGPVMKESSQITPGVGLTNVRQRLQHHYAARHSFQAANDPAGGYKVEIVLPLPTARTSH